MNAGSQYMAIQKKPTGATWNGMPSSTFMTCGNIPFPPPNNRSLCLYLKEESQEDGMRVLMDVALSRWYSGVVPYWNLVQQRQEQDGLQRSLFVCYEDLVDPFQQEGIFYKILEWMYPGRDMSNQPLPASIRKSLARQQGNQTIYSGGHSTTNDPKLRATLRTLVERLDSEMFHHTIAKSNAIFGCGAASNVMLA